MKTENKILYDWVSITSKIHSPQNFISLLGLTDPSISWEKVKGSHGYQDRLYWNMISIHFNGTPEMGIWLELTGQGCRAFESYGTGNYEALFQEALDNPGDMNITRLDVAFDDHSGVLDIDEIFQDTQDQNYIARFSSWDVRRGSSGTSVMLGSKSSLVFIRIYDKAAERGFTDGRHWVRVELQLRDDRAKSFLFDRGTLAANSPVSSLTIADILRSLTAWIQTEEDGQRKLIGPSCLGPLSV